MAVTHVPVFVQTPKLGLAKITIADTTTLVPVVTAGADGSKVVGLNIQNSTGLDQLVGIWITRSAVDHVLVYSLVPANAGSDGIVPTYSIFTALNGTIDTLPLPVDNDGQKFLLLESGDVLSISADVTLISGALEITSVYGDF